jgi:hypothetical protein
VLFGSGAGGVARAGLLLDARGGVGYRG